MFTNSIVGPRESAFDSARSNGNTVKDAVESLTNTWKGLCDRYLPVTIDDSIWRYSRLRDVQDPEQGWKLHVSATILNAGRVLEIVGPFLKEQNVLYKAPISLSELKRINSGVYYSYTQVGKVFTVYPKDDRQAVHLAERLNQLTYDISAPAIPFDSKLDSGGCVYFRYGAFRIDEIEQPDGTMTLAMRDRQGNKIPDMRNGEKPFPDWVTNPFTARQAPSPSDTSPLKNEFRVFKALSQRGKGGVYQAIDLGPISPRLCVVKEGRRNGEVEWDGRDGYWRVQNEERVLNNLRAAGVDVPEVYSSFTTANNYYLATEYVSGETLHVYLQKRKRCLRVSKALKYAIQLSEIIAKIHKAGWLWRDCKPDNLMVTNDRIRPIDFEGACPAANPDPFLWSTLVIKSPSWYEQNYSGRPETSDLFALGAIIYLLFDGELPVITGNAVPAIRKGKVPAEIVRLISKLLDPNAITCIDAQTVTNELKAIGKGKRVTAR